MKKANILFIIHDLYQSKNIFPLGIGYLASTLEQKGHRVSVYCQDLFHNSNEELARYLDNNKYDIIGLGFLSARFKETIVELCDVITKHKKNAWLVLGGHGPSPIPEYIINQTDADIVSIGESEETIIDIVEQKISKACDMSKIGGIAWKNGEKVIINNRKKALKEMDDIPFPAWHLFPVEEYKKAVKIFDQADDEFSLTAMSSRGCINKCNFCYRMENHIRLRSMENFVAELKILEDIYKITNFIFADEMFVLNKKRLIKFEKELEKVDINIRFSCDARVDNFDRELAFILKRCGCVFINLGLESTDDNVLRLMNKNSTLEQNINAVESILSVPGIGIGLNFLWGHIGDTEKSLFDMVKFIKKYNTYNQIRTIRPPTPYPGSDLYYTAIEKNLLKGPEDFFKKFKNSDLYMVNFTDIPENRFYELIFEANKELILDHHKNTDKNYVEANYLIDQFKSLYFEEDFKFRGARKDKL